VDSNGFDAHSFRQFGHLDRDDRIFVPPRAQLDGQRNFYRGTHRAEDLLQQRHIAQEPGSAALDDFLRRAPEIDVDSVVPEILDHARGFAHNFRARPKKLRSDRMLVFLKIQVT